MCWLTLLAQTYYSCLWAIKNMTKASSMIRFKQNIIIYFWTHNLNAIDAFLGNKLFLE